VCGRPSLRQDDPIRSEMVTLARAGAGARLLAQIKTPTSPIALARSQSHAAAAGAPGARIGPRLWLALAVAGIAAALWWVAPWRGFRTPAGADRKSTRLNSSHVAISYAVFCLKKKKKKKRTENREIVT